MNTSEHQTQSLLMTQGEAAELLGVSRNTVGRLVHSGALATVKIGPGMAPRVRRADVVALAERGQE